MISVLQRVPQVRKWRQTKRKEKCGPGQMEQGWSLHYTAIPKPSETGNSEDDFAWHCCATVETHWGMTAAKMFDLIKGALFFTEPFLTACRLVSSWRTSGRAVFRYTKFIHMFNTSHTALYHYTYWLLWWTDQLLLCHALRCLLTCWTFKQSELHYCLQRFHE